MYHKIFFDPPAPSLLKTNMYLLACASVQTGSGQVWTTAAVLEPCPRRQSATRAGREPEASPAGSRGLLSGLRRGPLAVVSAGSEHVKCPRTSSHARLLLPLDLKVKGRGLFLEPSETHSSGCLMGTEPLPLNGTAAHQ